MKATNILKSKRGIAIENAIMFLLVIFALCSLLTMIVLIANYQFKIDNIVLKQDVDLDQVGEEFIAKLPDIVAKTGELDVPDFDFYVESVESVENGSTYILTVGPKGSTPEGTQKPTTVLLYVEAKVEGSVVTILQWRYSQP